MGDEQVIGVILYGEVIQEKGLTGKALDAESICLELTNFLLGVLQKIKTDPK